MPTDDAKTIIAWKFKEISEKSLNSSTKPGNSLASKLVEFKRNCLKQGKITFTHRNVVNLFVDYEINMCSGALNTNFKLNDCLFGVVKLTKNADPDKY